MLEHVTPDDLVAEVMMVRSAHAGTVLLVEGDTDAAFFAVYVDSNACHIVPAHGKERLVAAVLIMDGMPFPGVLGIVDADFDKIMGLASLSPNIIATDVHDLDLLLVLSPALDAVLTEVASGAKVVRIRETSGRSVREILIQAALPVGLLRLASHRRELNLKFEDVDLSGCIDRDALTVDLECVVQRVVANTRTPGLRPAEIVTYVMEEYAYDHPVEHACCGSDVIDILAFGLRRIVGTQPTAVANSVIVGKMLRMAYDSAYLATTELWKKIRAWEASNPPYRVLLEHSAS